MHLAFALALSAAGMGGSALLADPPAKMFALTIGAFGAYAAVPIFSTLPTGFLAGPAVAAAPTIESTRSINGLAAGKTYTLTFWLSGNPDGPPATKSLDVSIGKRCQR